MAHLSTPLAFPLGGPFVPSTITTATPVEHVELGKSRLLEQFRHKPRINAVVNAMLGAVNVLEQTLYDMLTQRGLSTAEGAQLDVIGVLFGIERGGRTDTAFRKVIRAQIRALRSGGTPNELYAILDVLDPTAATRYWDLPLDPASLRMSWTSPPIPNVPVDADALTSLLISRLLKRSRAAGVRAYFRWHPRADADLFTLCGLPRMSSPNTGLANLARTTGGHLIGEVVA